MNGFDGSEVTVCQSNNDITITFNPPLVVTSDLTILRGSATSGNVQYEVNMGSGFGTRINANASNYVTLANTPGSCTAIKVVTFEDNGGIKQWAAIKLNGNVLDSSDITLTTTDNTNYNLFSAVMQW